MKKILQRARPVLAIILSVLVMLISIGGIAGIWVVERAISSAAVQMLGAFDNTAQIMRDGITSVDSGIGTLAETVSTVETASAQLSQNVNDKGLLLTLLPPTKEQELTVAAQSVWDHFASIWDLLNTTKEAVQAINSLPFIELPGDGLASVETLQDWMDGMMTMVEELNAGISESRSQTAANISKITETTANLNDLLAGLRSDLTTADAELNAIQTQSRQLQKLLPTYLLLSAIVLTLLAIWIGYSQFVVINGALKHLRSNDNLTANNQPGDSERSDD
jgi:prefoldin subunit 5